MSTGHYLILFPSIIYCLFTYFSLFNPYYTFLGSILHSNKNKLKEIRCPLSDLSLWKPSHAPSLSKAGWHICPHPRDGSLHGAKESVPMTKWYTYFNIVFYLFSCIWGYCISCRELNSGASVLSGCQGNPDIFGIEPK